MIRDYKLFFSVGNGIKCVNDIKLQVCGTLAVCLVFPIKEIEIWIAKLSLDREESPKKLELNNDKQANKRKQTDRHPNVLG